ncbi:MAG TPA: transaldolase family protein [Spirillospora sp.]|nr:transaldolase family protein [Spirillospora sp.]
MSAPASELFIDGGNAQETQAANDLLRSLRPDWQRGIDGQTTNPTLVAKNPDIQKYLSSGKKLTQAEALADYRKIVEAVAAVTNGPVSIQVIADQSTKADDMLSQARRYRDWIPNGVVKFPCTAEGLAAAEVFCQEFPVNITLNFTQSQAAAVFQATRHAKFRVFISPFVGRLDDLGENGMDLVANELKMYAAGDGHVDVLTASVRNVQHLMYALQLESPAITIPFKVFQEWVDLGLPLPDDSFHYDPKDLKPIPYKEYALDQDWRSYDLKHKLTDAGLTRFMQDWQSIIK